MAKFIVKSSNGKVYKVNAPEGSTKEDAIAYIQAKYPSTEFSAAKTLQNVPSSALQNVKNTVTGLGQMVFSPVQTANSMVDLAAGTVQNMLPQGALDFVGQLDKKFGGAEAVQLAKREREVASNVGQYYKDRYGGEGNILRTVQQDPVGVLSDASALFTGGGSLVPKVGNTIRKAGAAIEPLSLATNLLSYGAAKAIPSTFPAKLYESAAKWTPSIDNKERIVITQTALDNQIMPTYSGIGKTYSLINDLGLRIDNLIESSTQSGVKIPASSVLQNISNLRKELGGFKIEAKPDLAALNKFESNFRRYLKSKKIKDVTPAEMQAFKQDVYATGVYQKKSQTATKVGDEIYKDVARMAKESIESQIPEIGALNATQGKLLALRPHLERSAARIENRDLMGIGSGIKAAGGAALGGTAGAFAGAAQSFFDMPITKAYTALQLYKKQKQGLGLFLDNNPNASLIRQFLQQQGAYNQSPYGLLDRQP